MKLTTKLSMFLVLALMLVAPMTMGGASRAAAQDDQQLRFVFVTHDLGAGIFAPVRRGMEDACALIEATCEFLGPPKLRPQSKQVQELAARAPVKEKLVFASRLDDGEVCESVDRY